MAGWERALLHRHGNVVTLRLRGDFDVTTAPRLRVALLAAYRLEPAELIVSLREVSFLDAVTVGVLASARRRLRTIGCQLRIEGSKPCHARVLELAGLPADLTVVEVPRARVPALDEVSTDPSGVDILLLM
jgi:anti-anti-sigma factor